MSKAAEVVPVAIYEGIIPYYKKTLSEHGDNPLDIRNYGTKHISRPVADLILFQKALAAGGMNAGIKLIPGPNELRNLKNIQVGLAVAFGEDMWDSMAKNDFYVTDPIVRKKDFIKLFYVKKSTAAKYGITSLDGLKTLTGITVEGWHKDREVLEKLGLDYITAPNWRLMWKMLEHGRADYLFLEPCCDYKAQVRGGVTVVPIEGIKASFMEPRSFLVYKKNPMAKKVFKALDKGVKMLRENGEIEKAMIQSCVIVPALESWKDLSPE